MIAMIVTVVTVMIALSCFSAHKDLSKCRASPFFPDEANLEHPHEILKL